MKTAIILAAGVGSRLRPLTDNMPKCCVRVADQSLIRRVVQQLLSISKDMSIYVVTGYRGEAIHSELSEINGEIQFIENPDYQTTNNMESCRLALAQRREHGPSLIINADCIYDDSIIEQMVLTGASNIAIDSNKYFEENMKVRLVDGRVMEISKTISEGADVATSIDIYSFTAEDVAKLLAIMERYHQRGDLTQWTEVAINDLARDVEIGVVDVVNGRWAEIDNLDDLSYANRLFAS